MGNREAFKKSHEDVKEACNDVVCAVYENPRAFENIAYVKPKPKPLPSSYRHLGIIALIGAALARIGFH